jgi:hypothetical protein
VLESDKGERGMSQDSCDDEDKSAPQPKTIVEIPESNRPREVTQEHKKPSKFSSMRKLTCLNVTFNGILAVTTFFLVVSAIYQSCILQGQWESMAEGNRISRDALVSVQRAFVFPRWAQAIPTLNDVRFKMTWENSGSTPTRGARTYVSAHTFDGEMPDNYDFPDLGNLKKIHLYIGPKSEISSSEMTVPNSEIISVREHRGRLYLWGWITYRDIFDDTAPHITKFCHEVIEIPNAMGQVVYSLCPRNNCTDEECSEQSSGRKPAGYPTNMPYEAR